MTLDEVRKKPKRWSQNADPKKNTDTTHDRCADVANRKQDLQHNP
jgi:hypothetical protein